MEKTTEPTKPKRYVKLYRRVWFDYGVGSTSGVVEKITGAGESRRYHIWTGGCTHVVSRDKILEVLE